MSYGFTGVYKGNSHEGKPIWVSSGTSSTGEKNPETGEALLQHKILVDGPAASLPVGCTYAVFTFHNKEAAEQYADRLARESKLRRVSTGEAPPPEVPFTSEVFKAAMEKFVEPGSEGISPDSSGGEGAKDKDEKHEFNC